MKILLTLGKLSWKIGILQGNIFCPALFHKFFSNIASMIGVSCTTGGIIQKSWVKLYFIFHLYTYVSCFTKCASYILFWSINISEHWRFWPWVLRCMVNLKGEGAARDSHASSNYKNPLLFKQKCAQYEKPTNIAIKSWDFLMFD